MLWLKLLTQQRVYSTNFYQRVQHLNLCRRLHALYVGESAPPWLWLASSPVKNGDECNELLCKPVPVPGQQSWFTENGYNELLFRRFGNFWSWAPALFFKTLQARPAINIISHHWTCSRYKPSLHWRARMMRIPVKCSSMIVNEFFLSMTACPELPFFQPLGNLGNADGRYRMMVKVNKVSCTDMSEQCNKIGNNRYHELFE